MFSLTPGFASGLAPGFPAADDAVTEPGAARQRHLPGLRHAGGNSGRWTLGFFLNHVLFGMNLQEAIDARPSTPTISRPRSIPAAPCRARCPSRRGPGSRRSRSCGGAGTHQLEVTPPWSLATGQRGRPRPRLPVRGRQPEGHAGLRRRPVTALGDLADRASPPGPADLRIVLMQHSESSPHERAPW